MGLFRKLWLKISGKNDAVQDAILEAPQLPKQLCHTPEFLSIKPVVRHYTHPAFLYLNPPAPPKSYGSSILDNPQKSTLL